MQNADNDLLNVDLGSQSQHYSWPPFGLKAWLAESVELMNRNPSSHALTLFYNANNML